MKILITGCAGFIGMHLSKKLLEQNEIIGIDNINSYYDTQLKKNRLKLLKKNKKFSFFKVDITDFKKLSIIFKKTKPSIVIHLASEVGVRNSSKRPRSYLNTNIMGFFNILESCKNKKINKIFYASSSSVYGNNTKMPLSTNDNVDHPISLYAATKKSNELMAHTYSHLFGIPTTGLRFFTVYGPWGRPDMALFLFTKAIKEGNPIKVFNNGNMVRDFTYVADIVEGVVRVLDNPAKISNDNKEPSRSNTAPYKVYNIGNSSPVQLMDYIKAVEVSLEKNAKKDFLPIQPGDVPVTNADVEDLIVDLGYKPNTDINFGVAQFVDWFNDYYK